MKPQIVYIVLSVLGYQFPTEEFGRIASQVKPISVEVVDIANERLVEEFDRIHYELVRIKITKSPVLFLHPGFLGGFSGGKAKETYQVANVAIVLGWEPRNLQVALHEWGHLNRMRHVSAQEGCYIMNPQPCGFEWDAVNLKRARKLRKRK